MGLNGNTFYVERQSEACYVCGGARGCDCADPTLYELRIVEQRDSERRMDMLGVAVFGVICFGLGFALAAVAL